LADDHRGERGYVGGKPYEIADIGPYPAGWATVPPPPTAEELKEAETRDLMAELAEIDAKSVRPVRAIAALEAQLATGEGNATEIGEELTIERAKLASLETNAHAKRERLAILARGR
jgi:hypothetical protein